MKQRWTQYLIFISSTFIDMDAERDAIKFDVIKRLNRHFQADRVEFQAVDLRSGINTESLPEEEREDHVLDVCFSSIDAARPFFIGLLGGRYGWIPPRERLKHILQRIPPGKKALLEAAQDLSVTELEFLYGAIGNNGEYLNHSLFYYRDPASYQGVPEEKLAVFLDEWNPRLTEMDKKRNALKRDALRESVRKIVRSSTCQDVRYTEYTLSYDTESRQFDMSAFADLVYGQLVDLVEREIGGRSEEDNSWTAQESAFSSLLQSRLIADSIDRTALVEDLKRPLYLEGEQGMGKSVLLAQLYEKDPRDAAHKHIAFVGMTPYAFHIRTILLRWLSEMGVREQGAPIPETKELSDEALSRIFLKAARDGDHSFYLDRHDGLPVLEQGLGWLADDIPIIIDGSRQAGIRAKRLNEGMAFVTVPPYKQTEEESVISHFCARSYFDIPDSILEDMRRRAFTPAQLSTLLSMLTNLTATDFAEIRSRGGQISEINRHLEQLYRALSDEKDDLFLAALERFSCHLWNIGGGLSAFEYLALSPLGLREADLEQLLGDRWDPLGFTRITTFFDRFFVQDPNTRLWQINAPTLQSALQKRVRQEVLYADLARHVFSLPDSDPLKSETAIYYAIKAHAPHETKRHLCSIEPYESLREMADWFFQAYNLIVSTPSFLIDMDACCQQMDPGEASVFLHHFFTYGSGFYQLEQEHLTLVKKHLLHAPVSHLDALQSFSLGWLTIEANLYQCHLDGSDYEIREKFLCVAFDSFRHAVELNPDYKEAKTMITPAGTELMELYIAMHRFGDFQSIYDQLNA